MAAGYANRSLGTGLAGFRRSGRRRALSTVLIILAYLFTGAIVPPGHMAAGLATGTAFHLCHSDPRSALLLRALATPDPIQSGHGHHHGGHHYDRDDHWYGAGHDHHGAAHNALESRGQGSEPSFAQAGVPASSVDTGCGFSSAGADLPTAVLVALAPAIPSARPTAAARGTALREPSWLRPPARSPPV